MNLPDSFYIALCMTILLVGAVYWVWTQIQYVQRKVNVLENIVYELKTLCSSSQPYEGGGAISPSQQYPPAPSSVMGEDDDLLHQTLRNEIHPIPASHFMPVVTFAAEQPEHQPEPTLTIYEVEDSPMEEPMFDMRHFVTQPSQDHEPVTESVSEHPTVDAVSEQTTVDAVSQQTTVDTVSEHTMEPAADDLQPGGVGSGIVPPPIQSSLEGMTIKELRRLAHQKGISGATDMKKREIIEAIRAVPIESFLE